jgi:MFS family permease
MADHSPDDANRPEAYETPDEDRPASAEASLPTLQYETQVRHDPYAALRTREYRLFAASFVLAVVGGQIQSVALAWQVYQQTKSPMSLGWLGGIQVIPLFLLALPAGQLADVVSRRKLLLVTQVLLATCSLALAGLTTYLSASPTKLLPAMYGVLLLNAVTLTFARPARAALLPQLVPKEIFTNAVTWNASSFELSSMAGPAIGGLIVAYAGAHVAYLIDAMMLLACVALTYALPEQRIERSERTPEGFAGLLAGIRFVWRAKLLLATLTLDLFAVLLGGAVYILPIFAERLGLGSVGYGWMKAAPSIGAFSMALFLAHRPPLRLAGRALLLAVTGFGVATILFGISWNFWLSLAMLVTIGALDNVSVVVRHSLVQLLTPDPMRGRVSAVNQIFIGSSNELGGLESGLTAAWFGPVASVVGGGIGTILVVCGVALAWPQVRTLGSLKDVKAE